MTESHVNRRPILEGLTQEYFRQKEQRREGETQNPPPPGDGRSHEYNAQRLALLEAQDEEMEREDECSADLPERKRLTQVLQSSPPFRPNSSTFSDVIRRRSDPEEARAEAPEPSGPKSTQVHQTGLSTKVTPPTPLETPANNGAGAPPPQGDDTQDPSPVDYNLEIEVEFSAKMIIEMQKSATLRARKTVIGRTLSGRASFKELQDCLKLHLPANFVTITLLTRGYFKILS
jgi:hypothetical protein